MGGANAASTRDATAQWHNPAAFGFFGRSEWNTNAVDNGNLSEQGFSMEVIGLGAGFTMTEDMGRYLDKLSGINFDSFGAGELSVAKENVDSLLTVAGVLGSLESNDALYADASAGISMQIGHFGVGVRMFGEAAAWTVADRDNLSLKDAFSTIGDFVDELGLAAANQSFSWDGSYALSGEQRQKLADALGSIPFDGSTIQYLDDKFEELRDSGKLDGSEIERAIDLFKSLAPEAIGNINSNLTTVIGHAFTVAEIPVTYGWAMNKNLSFGITAKAMYGTVLGTQVWIFNENNDQILDDLSDNYQSSLNFGLDLGVLYRIPNFQFALVGHNLNRPSFDGFTETVLVNNLEQEVTVADVKIDPQITFGAAFMPTPRFTLEADLDLLETGTLLDDYSIQRFSVGGEVDLSLVALRLGTYKNLAEDWQDWVLTAGVGLNLFGVRVDLGGAYSIGQSVEYDDMDIPSEARLYASLGLDF